MAGVLVTDNWGANRNPTPKVLTLYKTLSVTAVSGEAVTDTENFYNKDCPFPIKVLGFEVQCISVSGDGFSGAGAALTVALQRDINVDASPTAPVTPTWPHTLVSVNTSGVTASTDKLLFAAPANSGSIVNASIDQSYVAVPKGGSLRATLSAQATDSIGVSPASTPVELLAIVKYIPTATRDQLYN